MPFKESNKIFTITVLSLIIIVSSLTSSVQSFPKNNAKDLFQKYKNNPQLEALGKEELFFRALAKQNLGNLQGALSDFDAVLLQEETDVDTLVNKCGLLCDLGQFTLAIESCKKAIQLGASQSVYFNLGIAQQGLGDINESIKSFQIVSDFAQKNNNQELNQKATQRADLLKRVMSRRLPLESVNQFLYASDLALSGNINQAIQLYEAITRAVPSFTEAHLELANCLALQKNYKASLNHYQIAEQLNTNLISLYNNRAAVWMEAEGNYIKAKEDLQKARSLAQTQNMQDLVVFFNRSLVELDLMEKSSKKK